ncbi:hypothetical protein, partial [Bombilactobacillus bombi]|uniref:hypothetical protein n=1 Tax=Bombilactobacillus bombi TaxID=1303590 RepID=UPI001C62FC8F
MKQFKLLMGIEISSWKDSWIWSVIMVSLFPIIALSFISFIVPQTTTLYAEKVTTGAMVFPIILMGMNTYAINISASKENGEFSYYANLPISKTVFLATKLTSGFFMTLP